MNTQIKINSKTYTKDELVDLARNILSQNIGEEWEIDFYSFILEWFNDKDYIIASTSGSTGEPKIIHLKKAWMIHSAQKTLKALQLHAGSTALLCLPAKYIAGKMMIVRAFTGGLNLISAPPSSQPFQTIQQTIHFTALTPFQLFHSIQAIKNDATLKIIVGGGEVSCQLEEESQTAACEIIQTYGMTETCSHVALRWLNTHKKSSNFRLFDGISMSVNESNCLMLDIPYFENLHIETNDIVKIHSRNTFEWLGRKDNIINSGGIKVVPEVIENKLRAYLPDVTFFVAGFPDASLGQKTVLVVEGKGNLENMLADLKKGYSQNKPDYSWPKEYIIVAEIKKTGNGKLLRGKTIEQLISSNTKINRIIYSTNDIKL